MVRENPKPYKSGNILVHGLTCCKNCFNVWNRDVNEVAHDKTKGPFFKVLTK